MQEHVEHSKEPTPRSEQSRSVETNPYQFSSSFDEDRYNEEVPDLFRSKQDQSEAYYRLGMEKGSVLTDERGDQFTVVKMLGQGGMGSVLQMKDERTGMMKAVKFMHADLEDEPEMVKRFEREIHVLAKISNPFILAAHDVTHFVVNGKRLVGFVTDFVQGLNLEEKIDEEIHIESKKLVTLAGQLAFALESLREANIVHRDLKPANIFLRATSTGEEFVQIGDFGVVGFAFENEATKDDLFVDDRKKQLTQAGRVVGTSRYMAPEVAQGFPMDHRSDLYSFGVIMYEMAIGQPPFTGSTSEEELMMQVSRSPTHFKELGIIGVPDWIETIIFKLLEKKPNDRYQSSAEVFQVLKAGVAKNYPELLNEIPFIWDIKPEHAYDSSVRRAA